MKLAPLLVAGSLLANVALAAVLLLRASTSSTAALGDRAGAGKVEASRTALGQVDPAIWINLRADEPTDFVARLRAGGFPPAVIRLMARQLVREHFLARYQALAQAEAAKPYWRGDGRYATDAKLSAERRAIGRESQAMLQQLLGPEAMLPTGDQLATLQNRFGNLPPAKLAQLQSINSDYNDLLKQVRDAANGILLPQDRATLALLQNERDADVARLLSPEETVEYELRHSTTANRLHAQLIAFDPTEQEFRSLFGLTRAVDAEYGRPGVLSQEQRRVRADAMKQLASQIETALGPARYADYQQAIDPNYQQAVQLVTRPELPRSTAAEMVALQKDVEQRSNALRVDRTLSNEQRQAQFAALNAETTTKLTASLGARGVAAYKQSDGYWLQNLEREANPRPAPKPAPTQPTP